ncbi:NAD(P)-binding protein [Lentithecium fluviatile CBS 122367]|uniref:NAD(P)-binding protein n=1 Tax=Lentithecium fluviatile CBS 122367 TaxID=1168545 RepID=A0A6G1IRD2_9PLEO|nr:NAD(P)-binding protein [Lentithecium fluviatile CBS 122367]
MGTTFSQFLFIPKPALTSETCPYQIGRVFFVTGGYSGIGFELISILYEHNATVYIAGRSSSKGEEVIAKLKQNSPNSAGRLHFLTIDLGNLANVKAGAEAFLANEHRLDVLVNNAGILLKGTNDPQHNEKTTATNCLGPALLYKLFLPLLSKTAAISSTATVRVTWAASIAIEVNVPPAGMDVDDTGKPKAQDALTSYGQSKTGNVFLARHYAKDTAQNGIVHVAFNPGNLRSNLQRHWSSLDITLMKKLLFFPAVYGAYTELWAAIAPDITPDKSGAYIFPWGRFGVVPAGIEKSLREESDGGTGVAVKFAEWVDKEIAPYL